VTLDAQGFIEKIELANNNVTVTTSLEDLLNLWKSKGLPTGKSRN